MLFFNSIDTYPPIVTCSNVTLSSDTPNTFSGLTNGTTYTYNDASPDPNGVTYNVTEEDLFLPGLTTIALYAVDEFNNTATCLFHVENARKYGTIDLSNITYSLF